MGKLKTMTAQAAVAFVLSFALVGCFGGKTSGGGSVKGVEGLGSGQSILKALITAREVDVTGDDDSLLPDTLTLQDVVYVIVNPNGGKKAGKVKVTRDPSDMEGFGWVETKNIRTLSGYVQAGSAAPASSGGGDDFVEEAPIEASGGGDDFADEGFADDAPVEGGGDDFLDDMGDSSAGDDFSDEGGDDSFSEDDLFGDE